VNGGVRIDGLTRSLFPGCVATAEATGEKADGWLFPEEEAAVRSVVPKRQREFRIGRACARAALQALGFPPSPLPVGPERTPIWPEGVVGSITHTQGFCAAVVGRSDAFAGLGVDAERSGAVRQKLLSHICTERERLWMAGTPPPPGGDWPTIVFSAKESVYKAVNARGRLGRIPAFQDAAIFVPPTEGAFRVDLQSDAWPSCVPRTLGGRFRLSEQHVVTGVWIRAFEISPARARC